MLIIFFSLIFASIIFLPVRLMFVLRKQNSIGCRKLFDKLIRCLHYCGLLTGLNGSEEHFAEVLCHAVPAVSSSDSVRLVEILQKVNFSENEFVETEERDFVQKIYEKSAKYLYKNLKWYKKPIFRYIKCFC